jgi:hypothetical protein
MDVESVRIALGQWLILIDLRFDLAVANKNNGNLSDPPRTAASTATGPSIEPTGRDYRWVAGRAAFATARRRDQPDPENAAKS